LLTGAENLIQRILNESTSDSELLEIIEIHSDHFLVDVHGCCIIEALADTVGSIATWRDALGSRKNLSSHVFDTFLQSDGSSVYAVFLDSINGFCVKNSTRSTSDLFALFDAYQGIPSDEVFELYSKIYSHPNVTQVLKLAIKGAIETEDVDWGYFEELVEKNASK
jgi:hypothetical protein